MTADRARIAAGVARLRAGGLVAFPTETVYGLGARAMDADAVARVFALKGRPARNPLIVHVSSEPMARGLVSRWDDGASRLIRAFWPGPLTLVLPKAERVPGVVTARGSTVAVRCPDHPLALALIESLGEPIVGPSANPSGHISPTTAEHVRESWHEDDVLVLDGGACAGGIESTVVCVGDEGVRVLRPGPIGHEALSAALGRAVRAAAPSDGKGPLQSPGMLDRHYAPHRPATMLDVPELFDALRDDPLAAVLNYSGLDVPKPHVDIPVPADAPGYARELYGALRAADTAAGVTRILIEAPPLNDPDPGCDALWRAVHDRLGRACAR